MAMTRSKITGRTWQEPIDGTNRESLLNSLHGLCDEPRCGRVLVALPVLRWHQGERLSRKDIIPERLDKFGSEYGMRGYRVFMPLGISSESALSALRRGHTARWSLMCLLCLASAQIRDGRYEAEFRMWSS